MTNNERLSLLHDLIDQVECFLEEKGISIPNEEKKQSESPATIYGVDYGRLSDALEDVLMGYGLLE